MAVDGVRKATESVDTYNVIHDVISSNVTDPLTGRASNKFIFSGFPNPNDFLSAKAGPKSWQYPIITIEVGDITRDPLTVDSAQTISKGTVDVEIEVHARASLERNQLRDDVLNQLYSNASELANKACLHSMILLGTTNDTEYMGEVKVKVNKISLRFSRID